MNELRAKIKFFKYASVEIVAICNVAILVFGFFVLTEKYNAIKPNRDFICAILINVSPRLTDTISITGDRVTLQIPEEKIRATALKSMSEHYHLVVSRQELSAFQSSGFVNFSMAQLKDHFDHNESGSIPTRSDTSELFEWILQSRLATRAFYSRDLRLVIKTGENPKPKMISRITDILKKQKINRCEIVSKEQPATTLSL